MATVVKTATVLGKRKTRTQPTYILHLSATSESEHHSQSDYEPQASGTELEPVHSEEDDGSEGDENESSTTRKTSRKSSTPRPKQYICSFASCPKAYTKPSRLAEHERSHTGSRPFVCETCKKAYLRESHLQAHARSHLPASERPFVCDEDGCGKRFWTTQHKRVHEETIHRGEKPFKCEEEDCDAAFVKHGQLRVHTAAAHSPVGTKPFPCTYQGCGKSFASNQKLRTHAKVHDESRYVCSYSPCTSAIATFPTWTALQAHVRTAHPPTCPHCSRIFANSSRLRSHLKVHEQRAAEEILVDQEEHEEDEGRPKKRRRGGELGRDFLCEEESCNKAFKSKQTLNKHRLVVHEHQRNFTCATCGRAFGYKHIMLRHAARVHQSRLVSGDDDDEDGENATPADDEGNEGPEGTGMSERDEDGHYDRAPASPRRSDRSKRHATPSLIDNITGKSYAVAASTRRLGCPYPNFDGLDVTADVQASLSCSYVFNRTYDLRRHLRAVHEIEIEKDILDNWARQHA